MTLRRQEAWEDWRDSPWQDSLLSGSPAPAPYAPANPAAPPLPVPEPTNGLPFPVAVPDPPLVPPVVPNTSGGGGGGGNGGGGNGGGGGGGWLGTSGGLRPIINTPGVPGFNPNARLDIPSFIRPTAEAAFNDPGYQFRLNSGRDALERSAAARGVLRTGGTLKDIIGYGQEFGASEYNNIFNRELSAYDRRYKAATDTYGAEYGREKDQYAPQLAEWQARAEAERMAALAGYQREWDMYQFNNMSAAQQEAARQARRSGGGGGPNIPPPPLPPVL